MSVVALDETGTPQTVAAERVPIRLGTGAFTSGRLAARAIDQAVRTLRGFRATFNAHGVTAYRAVATSAVRGARNRDVLIHRVHREAGLDLQIIDGDEEARLVRKAALHVAPDARCILDLGGGSLEVNLKNGDQWHSTSLPIGTVRLLETFGLGGALTDTDAAMVRRYAATLIATIDTPSRTTAASAVILGGNAEALATLVRPTRPTAPFSLRELETCVAKLLPLTLAVRMRRFGLRRDRADVIAIAGLVFITVARQLGISEFAGPGVGLREALIYELIESAQARAEEAESDATKAVLTAARQFAQRVEHDTTHGEHVRGLARSLFQQLADVHGLAPEHEVTLEVAALLHDIGEVVNQRGHQKHSEYMIRHGNITGLDDERRAIAAVIARCHRKDDSEARRQLKAAALPRASKQIASRLVGLLRLADSLDFEHRQRVEQVVCTRQGKSLYLDVIVRDRATANDRLLIAKCNWFASEFGLTARLSVGRAGTVARPRRPRRSPPRTRRAKSTRKP